MNNLGCYGTCIPTYTGKVFDPYAPDIHSICIEDIAHHLSNLCRFGGSTSRFYSVAEHSIMVSYLVHPDNAKWGLLHDASEAYVIDLPKPLKVMFPEYKALETIVQQAICEKFLLQPDMPIDVKEADLFALAREGEYFHDKGAFAGFWQAEFAEFMQSISHRGWHQDWNDYFYFHQPPNNDEVKELFLDRARELGIQ